MFFESSFNDISGLSIVISTACLFVDTVVFVYDVTRSAVDAAISRTNWTRLYSYYEKEMSSKFVLHKESAISRGSKINILVNELLKVMRNTSLRVQQQEKDKHVQHFLNKMQLSGYDQEDRVQVYKKAKRIFEEKIRGKNVYPHVDKITRMKECTREKVQKKKRWFKQGKYKSVFYVDAIPLGSLATDARFRQK